MRNQQPPNHPFTWALTPEMAAMRKRGEEIGCDDRKVCAYLNQMAMLVFQEEYVWVVIRKPPGVVFIAHPMANLAQVMAGPDNLRRTGDL